MRVLFYIMKHMSFFITGTDTNVGKTYVTMALAALLLKQGFKTCVYKPFQTGCEEINGSKTSPDIDFIKKICPQAAVFSSYNLDLPAAPSLSAEVEDINIDLQKIKEDYKKLKNSFDKVLVEGAGGLAVPCFDNFLMADMSKELDLPVIIVAKPDLGTINHTVLTVEFARSKGLKIKGIIISNFPKETEDVVIKAAPNIIEKLTGQKVLCLLPSLKSVNDLTKPDIFYNSNNLLETLQTD